MSDQQVTGAGARLLQNRLRRSGPRGGTIPVLPRDRALPLSFAQRRLWTVDKLRTGGTDYLVSVVLRLHGPVEPQKMAQALTEVVRRHEVLRTRYTTAQSGQPVQVIDPPTPVDLKFTEDGDLLDTLLDADLSEPFDLAEGPILRARLVRLAPEEHVLAVVVHHIAMDGWSTGVLVNDLASCYADDIQQPIPLQYADFASWQRENMSGERLQRGVEHWLQHLAGLPPLELPTDRQRPAVWDAHGETITFDIPAETASRAVAFGRDHQATPFMVYLAAFWALLSRYTGQDDFAVGSPVAGRTRVETENMLGTFVNMLVLRANLTGDPSFGELVDRSQATALDAYENQEVPFERIVDELANDRDLSTHPLFQVSFGLQSIDPLRFSAGQVTGEEVTISSRSAKFDQTWTLEELPDGSFKGEVTFSRALFDRDTTERMAKHYTRLLDAALTEPDRRVSDLNLLDHEEFRALVREPVGSVAHGPCLHETFTRTASRTPDAPALTVDGQHLTYAQLEARANQLAHRLRGLGVRREDLVGICLSRNANMVIAVLAVLKAGAAYLPLDPAHPADRIAYVLDDAGTDIVITESSLTERVPVQDAVISLDEPAEIDQLAALPTTAPETNSHPDDLAYVIYTSGSTGRPKGVQVSHANVVRLYGATQDDYRFDASDVWTLFHSYAFDLSVWEMWGAFLYGGRLVMVPAEVTRSPWDLLTLLADERVTVLNQTPSAFRVLVELAESGDPTLDRLCLRLVILGGEAVDVGSMRPWWNRFGDQTPLVVNMYGITETTVHVSYRPLGLADLDGDRSPIGTAMRDLTMHILDSEQRPVPVGVPGEIHVGGPGVARGYLGRPSLTAQRFVPDPYGPPGSRLYRSGDKARVLTNGDVGYLGRFDHQVKIRGFRIELGEVESCLAGHPDVETAVAIVHEPSAGDRRLVAYVVPKDGSTIATADVKAFAEQGLPSYMVPVVFITVPKLPLTVNGKVDRQALPSPSPTRQDEVDRSVAPRSADERAITEIWSRTLGIDLIGVHDNFFSLGGDSILAIRLVGALREAGLEVTVQDVFRHQTIAELARGTTSSTREAAEVDTEAFAQLSEKDRSRLPDGLADAYPMSMVQVGMISEMVADRRMNLYHNITSYLIRDAAFSLDALNEATNTVVARHEVLRTAFDLTSYEQPLQLVHRQAQVRIGHEDLRALPEAERDAAMTAFQAVERSTPFDVNSAPLLRFHVQQVTDDRWFLHFTECHAILDGWSHNSLVTELLDCYRAIRDGRQLPPNPAPAVRFADFIALERQTLAEPEHREFWAGRVESAEQLTLPAAWGDPDGEPFYEVPLSIADLDSEIRAVAKSAGTSRKSVLVSAHLAVWRAISGERPFFCGLVCNARPEVKGGDLLRGMFLNTVPMVAPSNASTWRELVRKVFAEELALWPHRRFPLPAMQRAFGDGSRLLEVTFNYIDFHVLDREAVDVKGSVDVSPNEFPLVVSTEPGLLVFGAQSSRIGRQHTEAVAALYRKALESIVADPDGDIVRALLPAADRLGLLIDGDAARKRVVPRVVEEPSSYTVPRQGAEAAIATVFAQVLDVDKVSATDDFFALGGHSLLMLRIIIRLREEHGIELKFRDFVEHRTVREIAANTSTDGARRSSVLWLSRTGDQPALFCVHPGGGSGHWYRNLAEELAPRRPVAALEWPGLNGEHEPARNVESIAAMYLADIRAAQPTGPYHLLGWCGGGGITWEITQRLTAEGEQVKLMLLDPVAVLEQGDLPTPEELVLLQRTESRLVELAEGRLSPEARAELGTLLREVVEDDHGIPIRDEEIGADWLPRVRTWRQLQEAERAYHFQESEGSLDLILCDELVGEEHVAIVGQTYSDYLRNWEKFARGGVRVHRVAGDHLGVLRPPHVTELSAVVISLLDGGAAE